MTNVKKVFLIDTFSYRANGSQHEDKTSAKPQTEHRGDGGRATTDNRLPWVGGVLAALRRRAGAAAASTAVRSYKRHSVLKWQHIVLGDVEIIWLYTLILSQWFFWVNKENQRLKRQKQVYDCQMSFFFIVMEMFFLQWMNYTRYHVQCTMSRNEELRKRFSAFGSVLGRWVVKQTCRQDQDQCAEAHLFSCKVVCAAAEQNSEAKGRFVTKHYLSRVVHKQFEWNVIRKWHELFVIFMKGILLYENTVYKNITFKYTTIYCWISLQGGIVSAKNVSPSSDPHSCW